MKKMFILYETPQSFSLKQTLVTTSLYFFSPSALTYPSPLEETTTTYSMTRSYIRPNHIK